ncbi:MAG: hypothetical protein M3007_08880 [Candidatus Eremiobacteraeota bacterium]|nr:hypothetical protein [Candidatus Eremiobacteraeota bacterium]
MPAGQVMLALDVAQNPKRACKGLRCVWLAQSIAGSIPGVQLFNSKLGGALNDAQMIAGLGDKAAWNNGRLTVLKNEVVFPLQVSSAHSGSSSLGVSEALTQTVLGRL